LLKKATAALAGRPASKSKSQHQHGLDSEAASPSKANFSPVAEPRPAPPQALAAARQLRPYQQRDLDEIRAAFLSGARAVLYVAPTGSGKTVLFTSLVDGTTRKGASAASSSRTGSRSSNRYRRHWPALVSRRA
jgi:superfamily II DNA or RNA helicase